MKDGGFKIMFGKGTRLTIESSKFSDPGLCCEASCCVNAGYKMLFGGGTRLVVETCK